MPEQTTPLSAEQIADELERLSAVVDVAAENPLAIDLHTASAQILILATYVRDIEARYAEAAKDLISRSALLAEIRSWSGYQTWSAGHVLDRDGVIDEIEDFPAATLTNLNQGEQS